MYKCVDSVDKTKFDITKPNIITKVVKLNRVLKIISSVMSN